MYSELIEAMEDDDKSHWEKFATNCKIYVAKLPKLGLLNGIIEGKLQAITGLKR